MKFSFDSVAQIYDETRGLPKRVMNELVRVLASELNECKNVLDAGVGTGRFAKPLQDSGIEVVGVDIAKKMIGEAVEKGVTNLLLGDVCFLPFKDYSFDATVSIHLLHLISGWKIALREICRVTSGIMVTILYAKKNPVREAYDHLLKNYGYESRRLGKGEWELKDMVKPSKSIFVATFESSADERLSFLGQRAYSGQWEVPEDVNAKVVQELRHQLGGMVFSQEMRILMWEIEDLKSYCSCA